MATMMFKISSALINSSLSTVSSLGLQTSAISPPLMSRRCAMTSYRGHLTGLHYLNLGVKAVGTSLNTHKGLAEKCAKEINLTGIPFERAPNRFEALASHDVTMEVSGALNTVACSALAAYEIAI